MTRLERAYQEYPTGLIYEGCYLQNLDCCPYSVDMGEDDLDKYSLVVKNNKILGCRGITCEQCWDKEFDE